MDKAKQAELIQLLQQYRMAVYTKDLAQAALEQSDLFTELEEAKKVVKSLEESIQGHYPKPTNAETSEPHIFSYQVPEMDEVVSFNLGFKTSLTKSLKPAVVIKTCGPALAMPLMKLSCPKDAALKAIKTHINDGQLPKEALDNILSDLDVTAKHTWVLEEV